MRIGRRFLEKRNPAGRGNHYQRGIPFKARRGHHIDAHSRLNFAVAAALERPRENVRAPPHAMGA